jgi:hypothetical protein
MPSLFFIASGALGVSMGLESGVTAYGRLGQKWQGPTKGHTAS